jgi:transposase
VSQKARSTFVLREPRQILRARVGLKDVEVVHLEHRGRHVELMIEQVPGIVLCPTCHSRAQVKERPVVHYVDLPVYGTPMSLAWKKHRLRCVNGTCAKKSWVLEDHRIAVKNCLLTTRAAKWDTVQVGGGRTVSEVAAELACDWHTVNDVVTTYGTALLAADRKRLNRTTAIGLDETAFVRCQRPSRSPHRRPSEVPADGHRNSPRMATRTPRGRQWFLPTDGHGGPRGQRLDSAVEGHHSLPGHGVGQAH